MEKYKVIEKINEIENWLIKVRRDLHMTPELSTQEFITKNKIIKYLNEIGIDYIDFESHNGVMAYILKENSTNTIAMRADIDALPIREEKDTPYKSINEGIMHACGHDAHTTMLLGACKILYLLKEELNINVKFLFQPSEEDIGGARFLIEGKCLENPKVDYIFGLHVNPQIETGLVETKYGTLNASTDQFEIIIKGKKAHGAYPEDGTDALIASAQVITALQSIISRNLSPTNSAVLTIGTISGGDSHNIICEEVIMKGTLRTLNEETRNFMIKRINKIIENSCIAFGCVGKINFTDYSYPALINNKECVDIIRKNTIETLGEDRFIMKEAPSLGGEDFSFYTKYCKGGFFNLGCKNKNEDKITPIHTSKFDIDESSLSIGVIMHVMNALYFN